MKKLVRMRGNSGISNAKIEMRGPSQEIPYRQVWVGDEGEFLSGIEELLIPTEVVFKYWM